MEIRAPTPSDVDTVMKLAAGLVTKSNWAHLITPLRRNDLAPVANGASDRPLNDTSAVRPPQHNGWGHASPRIGLIT
jgi:hypothetical protein